MARIDNAKMALELTKATLKKWPLATYLINSHGLYKKEPFSGDTSDLEGPQCWRPVELVVDDRMWPIVNHLSEGVCDLEWVEVTVHEIVRGKHDGLSLLEREIVVNPMYKVGRRP